MLSPNENRLVTEVEGNNPCANLLRSYWQPAALSEELSADRAAKAVRIFGEDLVLFRDDAGTLGLISRACPHRGADLSFGRLEDGGIRCPFHGWLFNVKGKCLEQPAEPINSTFHKKIKLKSYPCHEVNGIIFTYMGSDKPPPIPKFDCFLAPNEYTFAFKGYLECNWLQALEVGIDPSHASYLHRYLQDFDPSYGLQFGGNSVNSDISMTSLLRNYDRPDIAINRNNMGLQICTTRALDAKRMHVRVTNLVFPNLIVIPMTSDMSISQWQVPIDNTHSWWYAIFTAFENLVDKHKMRDQRLELYQIPDYRPKVGKHNQYGYNPEEQRTKTYTGMGMDINVHDQWAVESPGAIFDRSKEHLASSDKCITAFRKELIQGIKDVAAGQNPPFTVEGHKSTSMWGPLAIDTTTDLENWNEKWKENDLARRKISPWAKDIMSGY